MRNLLFCLAVMLLSSCIPVEDFGAYWKQGTVDPALLGTWVEIISPAKDADDRKEARAVKVGDRESIQVLDNGGTYRIDDLNEKEGHKKDYTPTLGRTLQAGRYTFLMVVENEGSRERPVSRDMVRYEIEGDKFREYSLVDGRMSVFLQEKYPRAKNIERADCKGKEKCWLGMVRIKKLDDEAFKILSEIPDTREFWTDAGTFRRQSRSAR